MAGEVPDHKHVVPLEVLGSHCGALLCGRSGLDRGWVAPLCMISSQGTRKHCFLLVIGLS